VSEIVRFSVSLENALLEQFDALCSKENFATRSEAVRQLIRDTLTTRAWETDTCEVAGTLTLVYDHHAPSCATAWSNCSTTTPRWSSPPCTPT